MQSELSKLTAWVYYLNSDQISSSKIKGNDSQTGINNGIREKKFQTMARCSF